jgi:hypothetical protein
MKKAIILITALACFGINGLIAQVYKTAHVDTAGTLSALFSAEELAAVTDLTLTGTINADDFNTMKTLMPALRGIDLGSVHATGDSIPGYAFNTGIDSVILPSSITLLGNHALQGCGLLTTLTIPSLVTLIGDFAFAGCSGLTSLILGESVTSIGSYAFAGCSGLPSIDLPDSVSSIGMYAFIACSGMKTITIPPLVTAIVDHAFEGCSWLDSISIGSSVASIGINAFAGCNSLRSVTIPSSVSFIAPYSFVGCPGLTSVTILSSSETTIGEYAFAGDANLASVTIHPSSGTSIGKYAFVSCSGLKTLNMISPSVTSIGEGCFIGNILESVVFPSSLKSVSKYAFVNSDSLDSVTFLPSSGVSLSEYAFVDCSNLVSLNMISPSVDSIGERCFGECRNLTSLSLPSSLVYIGNYAFRNCSITGSLIMPSSLTHIGEYAFSVSPGIDSLIFLPSSGTSIGKSAFEDCIGLTTLIMHSPSVDSIGYTSFDDCNNLTDVILPSSLVSMEPGAFGRCYALRNIRINRIIPPVIPESNSIFYYVSTGAVDLYVPAGTQDAYQAAEVWRRFHIVEFDLQLSASPDTLVIEDTTGSTATFDIQSTTSWQIISDQPWLTAVPAFGMDTAGITLTAEANPDTIAREAIVTVSGENVASQLVIVTQAPRPVLSVSTHVLDIGPLAGSTVRFTIASNQDWTVQSGQTWLAANPSPGNGNGEITMTAEANPDTAAREAVVTIYTGRLTPQTIVVTQAPKPALSVSSGVLDIGSQAGSTAMFNIISNTDWSVQSDQAWLVADPSSGNGNTEIALTAEANPDTAIREAIVTVSADGLPSQIVTVIQEGAMPSGYGDAVQEKIAVYPNPVHDVLYVSGAAGNDIILYDIKGRVIFVKRLCNDHETLDMSAYSPGDYVIKIGNKTVKIVK